jgi:restriction system protein
MTVWMVRAGAHGEQEDLALEHNVVVVGWVEMPSLSGYHSRDAIKAELALRRPDDKPKSLLNQASQLWSFVQGIQLDDLVVLPLKRRSAIAIGKITGGYQYLADNPEEARHTRPVEWLRDDLPRSAFGQDLLYSLGAFLTVCRIRRNRAEERIVAILSKGRDPALTPPNPAVVTVPDDEGDAAFPSDLEGYARDQIMEYIGQRFKGHALARLVQRLLEAQGYHTYISPEGPDGGADIIAGRGPMGFDPPRLCVQVKSSADPVDVRVLRELQGIMPTFGADQGLLVSWGGFRNSVYQEARQKYFQIRLWDAGEMVESLLAYYEQLADDIQAELPLKRIWVRVVEE